MSSLTMTFCREFSDLSQRMVSLLYFCVEKYIYVCISQVENACLGNFCVFLVAAGKSLLWMAILLLIILFIYSILSFAFFQRDFQATGDFHCDTLDQCFVSVIRNGLLGSFLVGTPFYFI